jgi:hypothetical protein
MAPRARFELATLRLTAECSTIELPGNWMATRSNCSKILRVLFNRHGTIWPGLSRTSTNPTAHETCKAWLCGIAEAVGGFHARVPAYHS